MALRSAPRVSRWRRGKPSRAARLASRSAARSDGGDGRSGAGVLARQFDRQPLAPLLAAAAEDLTPPPRRHPRAEAVRADAALVTRTVGWLAHECSRRLDVDREPAQTRKRICGRYIGQGKA